MGLFKRRISIAFCVILPMWGFGLGEASLVVVLQDSLVVAFLPLGFPLPQQETNMGPE